MNTETRREAFWSNLERAYADQDNTSFDSDRSKALLRQKKEKLENMLAVAGLVLAVVAAFFLFGIFAFSRMPY